MLRIPIARALSSSLLSSTLRQAPRTQCISRVLHPLTADRQHIRAVHAVSNPTLANIEKRWEQMPPQEQAELWMALRDRMKVDWHELTMQEKRASYWIAFGPHGPRAVADPKEKWEIMKICFYCFAASGVIFGIIRYFARAPPKTMSKEWQEMTNEYLKSQKTEAITGVSSEGYQGKGMVQSKATGWKPGSGDDE